MQPDLLQNVGVNSLPARLNTSGMFLRCRCWGGEGAFGELTELPQLLITLAVTATHKTHFLSWFCHRVGFALGAFDRVEFDSFNFHVSWLMNITAVVSSYTLEQNVQVLVLGLALHLPCNRLFLSLLSGLLLNHKRQQAHLSLAK